MSGFDATPATVELEPVLTVGIVEVFSPDHDAERSRGRHSIRDAVLRMRAPGDVALPAPPLLNERGIFWGLRSGNGVTLLLRVRDFRDGLAATRDADDVIARYSELELVRVEDKSSGLHSFWLTRHGRVVLVSGQAWRRPHGAAERAARRLLFTLAKVGEGTQ